MTAFAVVGIDPWRGASVFQNTLTVHRQRTEVAWSAVYGTDSGSRRWIGAWPTCDPLAATLAELVCLLAETEMPKVHT